MANRSEQVVAFTEFERDALSGLVAAIVGDGLDTYGLSGKEQAAVHRALSKLVAPRQRGFTPNPTEEST